MRIDCSSIRVIFITPHGVQNQISREYTLRIVKEEEEQIVFCWCDFDLFASPSDVAAFEIDFDVTKVCYAACIVAATPQNGSNSGDEFSRAERLDNVVVSADL